MSAAHTKESAPVALITGGARRIGAEIARQLHARGWRLLIHYRNSAEAAEALCAQLNAVRTQSAQSLKADLSLTDQVKSLAEATLACWQRLDLLVNNASAFYPTPLGSITEDKWEDLMASNLKAPLFLSQALAPALKKSGGCIVNLADIHALRPLKDHSLYCAAKAGNLMLTRSLALELAPEVRVNAIAPGAILWPEKNPSASESILPRIPLGRCGTPEDIAQALVYLTEASYVTGQVIAVDGGRSLYQ
jgi:pteridine reductase